LGLLASRISSPFKQVRSELSYLLVLVFRNLWHNPAVAGAARGCSDDAISAFFAAIPARVYKMKTTADVDADVSPPKRDDSDAMDEEVRSTPAEDTSHAREALLLTLWHATKTSASGAIAPYVHHFLRLLFASLGDEDRDTVNVAKQCAALAAQMILPEQAPRSSFVEHLLALPKPDTLWHTRAAMLPFLQYVGAFTAPSVLYTSAAMRGPGSLASIDTPQDLPVQPPLLAQRGRTAAGAGARHLSAGRRSGRGRHLEPCRRVRLVCVGVVSNDS
jgi:hypothetical protein